MCTSLGFACSSVLLAATSAWSCPKLIAADFFTFSLRPDTAENLFTAPMAVACMFLFNM
ncbi:hypothetical protein PR002_g24871 [Phytophthora rubi]|uniref:Uncharacterized protein n=1 Tax=Phytophthora rubi TaxID=129364 RepID=A0A6A3I7X6_9STRA|nr:hypothetical protein PR002_g24871 [Phytophthora rubi]